MHHVFAAIKRIMRRFSADHATSYAAAIAYYTLLSIFPFILFAIGLAGYFISDSQRAELTRRIASALGSGISSTISQQVDAATRGSAGATAFGLITAAWSASAVFGAIRTGIEAVWDYHPRRNWLRTKARDLLAVVGFALVLGVSLASNIALAAITAILRRLAGATAGAEIVWLARVGLFVLPLAIAFLAFTLLYAFASDRRFAWRQIWPGAALVTFGFEALSLGFGFYLRYFGNYAKVYGTLGAVIAFLFYAYLLGCFILLGAELIDDLAHHALADDTTRIERVSIAPLPKGSLLRPTDEPDARERIAEN
jgi:membrane protein